MVQPLKRKEGPKRHAARVRQLKVLQPAGSRWRVFAWPNIVDRRFGCGPVGGAIFGNQFQSRTFVSTGSDAYSALQAEILLAF